MSTKLYVGNLSYDASENGLLEEFGKAGSVKSAKIVMDHMTGRSRGFAFVEMETADAAQSAIEAFDGKEMMGRTLKVNLAKERTDERPARSFGGGNRDRGGFGGSHRSEGGGWGGGRDRSFGGGNRDRY